jgi:hypothetical protein
MAWSRRHDFSGHGRKGSMRSVTRPRHYVPRPLLLLLRPVLRYSVTRDAYVLRGIGGSMGPVLRRAQTA